VRPSVPRLRRRRRWWRRRRGDGAIVAGDGHAGDDGGGSSGDGGGDGGATDGGTGAAITICDANHLLDPVSVAGPGILRFHGKTYVFAQSGTSSRSPAR
jgi:hypothetical protein